MSGKVRVQYEYTRYNEKTKETEVSLIGQGFIGSYKIITHYDNDYKEDIIYAIVIQDDGKIVTHDLDKLTVLSVKDNNSSQEVVRYQQEIISILLEKTELAELIIIGGEMVLSGASVKAQAEKVGFDVDGWLKSVNGYKDMIHEPK